MLSCASLSGLHLLPGLLFISLGCFLGSTWNLTAHYCNLPEEPATARNQTEQNSFCTKLWGLTTRSFHICLSSEVRDQIWSVCCPHSTCWTHLCGYETQSQMVHQTSNPQSTLGISLYFWLGHLCPVNTSRWQQESHIPVCSEMNEQSDHLQLSSVAFPASWGHFIGCEFSVFCIYPSWGDKIIKLENMGTEPKWGSVLFY